MTAPRVLLFALAFVLAGCDVDIKVKIGQTEKADPSEKPWQVFATNKETKTIELWWANYESHDDCVRNVKFDLRSSLQAMWYTEPAGCIYVGSDNKYVLYLMNKIYGAKAFMCVAKLKNQEHPGKEFAVIVNGATAETSDYRCVLP